MKKQALLFVATLMLLACASDPPAPAPEPAAPPPAPAPEPEPAPVEAEPEPAPIMADGPWRVSLISVRTEAKAAQLSQRFADKGYRVETEQAEVEGTTWQRVVFPGQHSRDEAQELLAKLEQEFGITGGWIPLPRSTEP